MSQTRDCQAVAFVGSILSALWLDLARLARLLEPTVARTRARSNGKISQAAIHDAADLPARRPVQHVFKMAR